MPHERHRPPRGRGCAHTAMQAGAAEVAPAHNVKSPPKRLQWLQQRTATLPRAVKTKPNFIVAIVQTLQLEKIKQQFPNAENGAARLNLRTANTHTLPPSKPSNRKSTRDAVEVKVKALTGSWHHTRRTWRPPGASEVSPRSPILKATPQRLTLVERPGTDATIQAA